MTKKVKKTVSTKDKQVVTDVSNEKKKTAEEKNTKEEKEDKHDIESESQTHKQTEDQLQKLSQQLEELIESNKVAEESAREWQDKYIRLSAEFDNYRKRTLKEKTELTKSANADLLNDILPVIDDFERGMANISEAADVEALKEGINLIYIKFVEFLKQNGVKEIEAKEKEFDIDFHEAITKIPAPAEDMKGRVIDVIQKGYLLNDKIIRYAKVVIGE